MIQRKVGSVFTSHVTKGGSAIQYKVVAIADGRKKYGFKHEPAKGTLIVKRIKKDGSMTGKNRIWATWFTKT